jgi:hypothetical protein
MGISVLIDSADPRKPRRRSQTREELDPAREGGGNRNTASSTRAVGLAAKNEALVLQSLDKTGELQPLPEAAE